MSDSPPSDGTGRRRPLLAGAVGGLTAGAAMGLVLHFLLDMMPVVAALIGGESVAVGWIVHLFNSTVFGLLFVPLARSGPGREMTETLGGCFSLGVTHGALLGLLTGGLLLPLSLQVLGTSALPVPLLPVPGAVPDFEFALLLAVAHLLYGLVLGGAYGVLTDARTGAAATSSPSVET